MLWDFYPCMHQSKRKMPRKYSQDLRLKCVHAYRKLRSLRKVASLIDVSKSSIHRWLSVITPIKRSFEARKASAPVRAVIDSVLGSCGGPIRRGDVKASIQQRLGVEMSNSCVGVWLRRQGYSRKKCSRLVNREDLEHTRRTFAIHMSAVHPNNVVSIDETGVYIDMKPSYGYSRRGHRCTVSQTAGWRHRYTVLMAVSNDIVIGYKILNGACNRSSFCEFIRSLDVMGRTLLLMDNASIHKGAAVADAARTVGAEAWYLPPYTPHFQPIENVFSVLKSDYRHSNSSRPVVDRVQESIARVTSVGLQNTFRSCWDVARRVSTIDLSFSSIVSQP